jgi:hypothetical protein
MAVNTIRRIRLALLNLDDVAPLLRHSFPCPETHSQPFTFSRTTTPLGAMYGPDTTVRINLSTSITLALDC